MGVPNEGQTIHMDGEHPSLSEWASTFSVNGRGIYINQIETCLKEMTSSDAEFKITFYLFLLGSLLASGTSNFRVSLCLTRRYQESGRGERLKNWRNCRPSHRIVQLGYRCCCSCLALQSPVQQ
ncbi:hypothetical protein ACOSQ3_002399 [Xanthoceras sorbifolium]